MGFVKKFVFFHFGPKNGGFGGLNKFEPPFFANLFGISQPSGKMDTVLFERSGAHEEGETSSVDL